MIKKVVLSRRDVLAIGIMGIGDFGKDGRRDVTLLVQGMEVRPSVAAVAAAKEEYGRQMKLHRQALTAWTRAFGDMTEADASHSPPPPKPKAPAAPDARIMVWANIPDRKVVFTTVRGTQTDDDLRIKAIRKLARISGSDLEITLADPTPPPAKSATKPKGKAANSKEVKERSNG